MKTSLLALATLVAAASTTACGGEFDPSSRISTLRVIAVRADVPYAHPGETVNLEALAHDPLKRPLTYGWSFCVNPIESTPQGCLAQIGIDAQRTGTPPVFTVGVDVTKFVVTVPNDLLTRLPVGARPNAMIGVIAVACPGTLTLTPSGGLPYTCTDAGGRVLGLHDAITGMKRVFIRSKDRNENPTIARVTFDGADWPETETKTIGACEFASFDLNDCDGEKHIIGAFGPANVIESGTDEYGNVFTEQVVAQYYSTAGLFENGTRISAKPETAFGGRSDDHGKTITLWLVLRDDRGGVSWVTRTIAVK
ncbi:MAG: hypothetical protein ABI175_30905 [Polyangiales bacterium]